MTCTVYIDESGDTGLAKLRTPESPGSTPYFVMGAVVLQSASAIACEKMLEELREDFGRPRLWKHATDLVHLQKVKFCRALVTQHVRLFCLISHKPTLGDYGAEINWEAHKFYNKCMKYLLELVGAYLKSVGSELHDPRIVVEDRNHDFDAMCRYLCKVKENPMYPQSRALSAINPFAIIAEKKSKERLLRLADLVSHAIYSCVNKTKENYGITEPRYLKELAPRFAADERGLVLNTGIKAIHDVEDIDLDTGLIKDLKALRAKPRPAKRVA